MSENVAPVVVHRLLKKDPQTNTGECSVCGLVAIRKNGAGFICAVKKAQAQKAWRERNPEKAAANRRLKSDHSLFNRDYLKLTAECVKCGPVTMTAWGRGYTCGSRAAELRSVQESAPAEACRECWLIDGSKVFKRGGLCPRCSDPRLSDTGAALRDAEHRADDMDGTPDGFHTVDLETYDPYAMPEDESAVPGWGRSRVLGSERPWNEVPR